MPRADKNSIKDTGIMSGGIAIGPKGANKGLKIRVLFDWKPDNGGPIPGPFELLDGGTGVSKTRDGKKHQRGEIYEKVRALRTEFEDGRDFLQEVRKFDPSISHPINANTMHILEGRPYGAVPRPEESTSRMPQRASHDIPSKEYIERLMEQLIAEGKGTKEGNVEQSVLREAILKNYYEAQGMNPPDKWWERVLETAKQG
ncbi:hypothetical protein SAMN02746041_02714 [Desulfacinum hydrothermale DSM 13146]|uniref:Uncharacterized protein n=1 Tax=Desulfacinum hydrothermale DSM 13146 TaxID=1121390 RepID=A0A1W1XRX7_9BACT|nr:hypothetical protein [Desulfacinum hydrothermale]SMC26647.1 hypothetical protein SAMN02746041_02714 [Desulfacinum hydrothermale DSM 13146]